MRYPIAVRLRCLADPRDAKLMARYEHVEAQRRAAVAWLAETRARKALELGEVVRFGPRRAS